MSEPDDVICDACYDNDFEMCERDGACLGALVGSLEQRAESAEAALTTERARADKAEQHLARLLAPVRDDEREFAGSAVVAWRAYHEERDAREAAESDRADLEAREAKVGEYEDAILRLERERDEARRHAEALEAITPEQIDAACFDYYEDPLGGAMRQARRAQIKVMLNYVRAALERAKGAKS